jgi:hypothetical protein
VRTSFVSVPDWCKGNAKEGHMPSIHIEQHQCGSAEKKSDVGTNLSTLEGIVLIYIRQFIEPRFAPQKSRTLWPNWLPTDSIAGRYRRSVTWSAFTPKSSPTRPLLTDRSAGTM